MVIFDQKMSKNNAFLVDFWSKTTTVSSLNLMKNKMPAFYLCGYGILLQSYFNVQFWTSCNFQVKSNLTYHIKTVHEGIKPFKCEYCDKKFGKKSAVKPHVANKHEK